MDKFAAISLTRDPRLRFYKDPAGEFAGKAPVQFVVDGEALGRETRMRPWCNPWEEDSDCEPTYSAVDRYEAEERVMTRFIPLRFVKAIWIESDVIAGNCDDPDEPFVTTSFDRRGRRQCAIRPQAINDLISLAKDKGVPVRDLRSNPRDASMARLGR
ncbi:MAG: hypothetical protein K5Q68_21835 [Roseococcus sp.]|nr:hypothetical protein [Roseococcus sp.]